jgi:hypothetical protein
MSERERTTSFSYGEEEDFVILETGGPHLKPSHKPVIQNPINTQQSGTYFHSNSIFKTSTKEQYIRIQRYEGALEKWDEIIKNPREFRDVIRVGIPTNTLRFKFWKKFLKADGLIEKYPGQYSKLLTLDDDFGKTKEENVIRRDVHRTFPQFEYFGKGGQESLFNVLKACALFDTQVGYIQSMAWIAGFLLLHIQDEEEAFWMMIQMLNEDHMNLKDLFIEGLPLLFVTLYQIEKLLEYHTPNIVKHFDTHCIIPQMYAAPFILTLFTNRFSYDVVTRIWDIFLFEGWKHIVRTMVGFIKVNQEEILKADPLLVVNKLYELAQKANVDEITNASFSITLTTKQMKSMEAEYKKTRLQENK